MKRLITYVYFFLCPALLFSQVITLDNKDEYRRIKNYLDAPDINDKLILTLAFNMSRLGGGIGVDNYWGLNFAVRYYYGLSNGLDSKVYAPTRVVAFATGYTF